MQHKAIAESLEVGSFILLPNQNGGVLPNRRICVILNLRETSS
ncbi:MAG: hypothetical protein WBP03_04215 [Candidatus Saccharimonadales bacterium]